MVTKLVQKVDWWNDGDITESCGLARKRDGVKIADGKTRILPDFPSDSIVTEYLAKSAHKRVTYEEALV